MWEKGCFRLSNPNSTLASVKKSLLGWFRLFRSTVSQDFAQYHNYFFRVGNRVFDLPDLPSSVLTIRRTERTGEPRCGCETGPTSKKKMGQIFLFVGKYIYHLPQNHLQPRQSVECDLCQVNDPVVWEPEHLEHGQLTEGQAVNLRELGKERRNPQ